MPGTIPIGVHLVPPIKGGDGFSFDVTVAISSPVDTYVTINVSNPDLVFSPLGDFPLRCRIPADHTSVPLWLETNETNQTELVQVVVGVDGADPDNPGDWFAMGTLVITPQAP